MKYNEWRKEFMDKHSVEMCPTNHASAKPKTEGDRLYHCPDCKHDVFCIDPRCCGGAI